MFLFKGKQYPVASHAVERVTSRLVERSSPEFLEKTGEEGRYSVGFLPGLATPYLFVRGTPDVEWEADRAAAHAAMDAFTRTATEKIADVRKFPRIALLGPPGTGKTYLVKRQKLLFLTAATHLAASTLGPKAITTQRLLTMRAKAPIAGHSRLVVDEFTMLCRADLDRVLALKVPLLLSGDFAQLCNPEGSVGREWLVEHGFEVFELSETKRTADPETLALYAGCRGLSAAAIARACIAAGVPLSARAAMPYPAPHTRSHFITSRNDQVDLANQEYAHWLATQAYPPDELYAAPTVTWGDKARTTTTFAVEGMLLIGIDTCRVGTQVVFRNQEVGYLAAVPAEGDTHARVRTLAGPEVRVQIAMLNPGFAVTFHRCQGQTFDFPIYICLQNIFHSAMLYVAVTRVTTKGHLTFIGAESDVRRLSTEVSRD